MDVASPRWMVRLLVAGATAMTILGVYGYLILGLKADWIAYYAAGRLFSQGNAQYLYNPSVVHTLEAPLIGENIVRFLYAPAYALPFVPWAALAASTARLLWLLIGLAASFLAAWISRPWVQLNYPMRVLGLLAFPALAFSLAVGQVTPLTLLVFSMIALLEWKADAGYLPGLLAGAVCYKPQLLVPLVLYWLWRRRWKSIAGFLFSIAILTMLSILVSRPATVEYLRLSLQFLNLAQFATDRGANAAIFAIHPWLGILTALGVILVLLWASRKESQGYSQALLWLSPILVTPYIVIYDFLLLILPISFLVPLLSKDRLLRLAVALLWFSSYLAIVILNTRLVTLAALGLFAVCAWRVLKQPIPIISSSSGIPSQLAPPG